MQLGTPGNFLLASLEDFCPGTESPGENGWFFGGSDSLDHWRPELRDFVASEESAPAMVENLVQTHHVSSSIEYNASGLQDAFLLDAPPIFIGPDTHLPKHQQQQQHCGRVSPWIKQAKDPDALTVAAPVAEPWILDAQMSLGSLDYTSYDIAVSDELATLQDHNFGLYQLDRVNEWSEHSQVEPFPWDSNVGSLMSSLSSPAEAMLMTPAFTHSTCSISPVASTSSLFSCQVQGCRRSFSRRYKLK